MLGVDFSSNLSYLKKKIYSLFSVYMIITLWWRIWSWKGTVSEMIATHLGYEIVSIGWMKRQLAEEMWLTILEFDKIWWENPEKAKEYDLKYEEYQQSLPLESKILLDSRLSFFCQPDAFKVFMSVSPEEWARRVFEAQRSSDESKSIESVLEYNTKREQGQQETYKKLYNVDLFDESNYTLVIDTTTKTPEEVFAEIIEQFTIFTQK